MSNIVLALTGASGAIYGARLLQVLLASDRDVHLTISPAATEVFEHELHVKLNLQQFSIDPILGALTRWGFDLSTLPPSVERLHYHAFRDYRAGIASGSFLTDGMIVCPCSMGTLAAIASGQSANLVHRAADVHLKERRKLVLVPRETPLSSIALGNMKTLADQGVVILPAMPGYYHEPRSMCDLVDFIVARVCDQVRVPHQLMRRWGAVENQPSGAIAE